MTLTDLLADVLVGIFPSDAKFKMVVSDGERNTWDVVETHYVDGDRSGVSFYTDKTIMSDASQLDAVAVINKLNEVAEKRRARRIGVKT